MGLSPPPGTPPTALSLRKYHYHRYLSSLPASSNLAAVPKSNTLGKSRGHRSAFLWLVGFPTITATYLLKVYSIVNEVGRLFIPSLIRHEKCVLDNKIQKKLLIIFSASLKWYIIVVFPTPILRAISLNDNPSI